MAEATGLLLCRASPAHCPSRDNTILAPLPSVNARILSPSAPGYRMTRQRFFTHALMALVSSPMCVFSRNSDVSIPSPFRTGERTRQLHTRVLIHTPARVAGRQLPARLYAYQCKMAYEAAAARYVAVLTINPYEIAILPVNPVDDERAKRLCRIFAFEGQAALLSRHASDGVCATAFLLRG